MRADAGVTSPWSNWRSGTSRRRSSPGSTLKSGSTTSSFAACRTPASRLTGIDPFTVFAPTMSARLDRRSEQPLYSVADERGWLREPTIVVDTKSKPLGSEDFDAYVFWPRQTLRVGRLDWMVTTLGRIPVPVDDARLKGEGIRLVQACRDGDADDVIPLDQVLLRPGTPAPVLMLRPGRFRLRVLDADGVEGEPWTIEVEAK